MNDWEKQQFEYYKNKATELEKKEESHEQMSGCMTLIIGVLLIILVGILSS